MGGKLSYLISEIVTADAIYRLFNSIPNHTFSFFFKYVDDILMGCNPDMLTQITSELNNILPNMPLKITYEDPTYSVNYLDITLTRTGRNINIVGTLNLLPQVE